MRRMLVLLWWLALIPLSVSSAYAHAGLVEAYPSDGSTFQTSPPLVRLRFSEPVELLELKLVLSDGQVVDRLAPRAAERLVEAKLGAHLPSGTHLVGYRVVSADGHPIHGMISFSVGQPSRLKSVGSAQQPAVLSAIWLSRIALYVSLFMGVGGAFFVSWVTPQAKPRGPSFAVYATIGFASSILYLGLQGLDGLGLPLGRLAGLEPWSIALGTSVAPATGAAVLATLLAVACQFCSGSVQRGLSVVALLVTGLTFSLSGHASTAEPRWLCGFAVFVHTVGVTYWIGALAPLLGLLNDRIELSRALQRFSGPAVLAVVAIAVSGVFLACVQLESWSELLRSSYGHILIAKLCAVVALVILAAGNRSVLSPAILAGANGARWARVLLRRVAEAGGRHSIAVLRRASTAPIDSSNPTVFSGHRLLASAGATGGRLAIAALRLAETPSAPGVREASVRGLGVTVRLELVLAVAVFTLAAGWRFTTPPRVVAGERLARTEAATPHEFALTGDGATAQVRIAPGELGKRRATIQIASLDTSPLAAEAVTLSLTQPSFGNTPLERPASKAGVNTWVVDDVGPISDNSWQVAVDVLVNDFEKKTLMEAQRTSSVAAAGDPVRPAMDARGHADRGRSRRLLYYRNPMGLPDTSPTPKKDPMGMDYIAVYESEAGPHAGIAVNPGRVQQSGVRTEGVKRQVVGSSVQAPGVVETDERLVSVVSVRSDAWIEKVENVTTGDRVVQGQALMSVYSPEISAAAAQYLSNIGNEGARRRLENLAVPPDVVAEIERTRAVPMRIAWRAPRDGIVLERKVSEGMRAAPGEVLFRIADPSTVWIVADINERELAQVAPGQPVAVTLRSNPRRRIQGSVSLVYPALNAQSRTGRVRIEIANPEGDLRPAMYADVEIVTGSRKPTLTVPDLAVVYSGTQQFVFLDKGEGRFEPREVKVGTRGAGIVEILEGVRDQDRVVVSGNFLIDSESNLKAALQTLAAGSSQ